MYETGSLSQVPPGHLRSNQFGGIAYPYLNLNSDQLITLVPKQCPDAPEILDEHDPQIQAGGQGLIV